MRDVGNVGEQLAVTFLEKQGYEILERNFIAKAGEIDIVARDNAILVFIEVKYYKENSLRDIHEAVDAQKQYKIMKAAAVYMAKRKIEKTYTRFDVILITQGRPGHSENIELYKDAFRYRA